MSTLTATCFNCIGLFVVVISVIAGVLRSPAPSVRAADIESARNQWVRTEDGRLLEYAKCGDLAGHPVYWQHGYGQSANYVTMPYMCKLAEKHHLMIIGISMPGFGLSDSMPLGVKRSLKDWPTDVMTVLDKEGIQKFSVMGTSAGCVHGASVAHAVPERVTAVLLNSPTAPLSVEKSMDGIAFATKAIKDILQLPYAGDVMAKLMSLLGAEGRMNAAPDVKAALDKLKTLAAAGESVYGEIYDGFVKDSERGCAHTYRGWVDNMSPICDDLPFSLAELGGLTSRGIKIGITTAPDDTTNPPAMQTWFRDSIPGSELIHFEPGWGHAHSLPPDNLERCLKYVKVTGS